VETEKTLVVLCGPTCTGKTAASLELAERIGAEIVAADSRTVYRLMDIGTAKPTPAQRAWVPHHLLDVAAPDEIFTVAHFRHLARSAIDDIQNRGKIPLLVGGTGLYIRAVTDDLQIPKAPPNWELRARLEKAERAEPGSLHRRLTVVDPAAAARIHPRNIRRLVRAIEVFETTGTPISSQQRRGDTAFEAARVGLQVERPVLYQRIDVRVDEQIAAGLVDEVRGLLASGYGPSLPSMQGLGYKEILAFLNGEHTMEEAVAMLKRNTRRYAKRQLTWFRPDPRIRWIDVTNLTPTEVAATMASMLE
jgi:tRNA dimethylallyltransferase